jgi:hypothetical protein
MPESIRCDNEAGADTEALYEFVRKAKDPIDSRFNTAQPVKNAMCRASSDRGRCFCWNRHAGNLGLCLHILLAVEAMRQGSQVLRGKRMVLTSADCVEIVRALKSTA